MCVYCKAASAILDKLWDDPEFKAFFYSMGCELGDLGQVTHDVFVPAYLSIKQMLKGGALEMLEAQVTDDVLSPLAERSSFREAWEEWDQATRDVFLREQSEMHLGQLLLLNYAQPLAEAYKKAFQDYLEK